MDLNRTVLEELSALNMETQEVRALPERRRIISIIKLAQVVLFPEFYHYADFSQEDALSELITAVRSEIRICLEFAQRSTEDAEALTETFIRSLPTIKRKLLTDIVAIYNGDPAAKTKAEVVLCYPGFYATSIYRLAHELYQMSVPYMPRIMSEYAHEKTGIDINPGAVIDEYFCIDHGTGIVVGETANIALIAYADGEKAYILAPNGLTDGMKVMNGPEAEARVGNCLPLSKIPVGTNVHAIELIPGKGARMVRSAGNAAQLMAKEGKYATLRLPSGEMRMVPIECRATIGVVGNGDHNLINLGKAGRKRHMGWRPTVRGSVMNPNDHPHGGGEGKAPVGRPGPCTPWGKPALGLKTRNKKKASNKLIIRRRDGRAIK